MGCLYTLPFLFVFLILFFSSAVFRILKALFGRTSTERWQETAKRHGQNTKSENGAASDQNACSRHGRSSNGVRRKIFDDDEGGYVDFEEIEDGR